VFFPWPRAFADEDLELARQLARAARGALERSRLYESERTARALSQQLARTGSLLATELDPAAVVEEVVEQAVALLAADAGAVSLLGAGELVVTAVAGDGLDGVVGARASSTGWLGGDVVQSRAPSAYEDVATDPSLAEADAVLARGYRAYLGVPLASGDGPPLGVLAVYARNPRTWREEEIDALGALAANASVAFANAELYQRVAVEREQSVAILANIADGIVAVDREGHVVVWNAAAEQITGVPAQEALGRTPAQVLQRDLESDSGGTNRLVSITRGGDEVWLSLSEAVMRDPAGAVAGRIFAFRDISAERVVEQMKSDFVSTVSHELRTPLTSIYGFAETLLRQDITFGEAERQTFLGYIASESERLTRIVDALLNVARLDTGDLHVQLEPTDIGAVVSDAVSTVQAGGATNGHSFEISVDDGELEAQADPDKLRQVLDQLVENAVKYSPEGGIVRVEARRRPDAVEITVADEGVGIPPSQRERIFSKFYRAGDDQGGGTGLGLFIAQGLVSAMGGRIWVDSEEGRGSRFTFELPAARRD
jgi:PAS domain S-box-containing protein